MRIAAATVAAIVVLAANTAPTVADDLADLNATRAKLEAAFIDQDAETIRGLMTPSHIAATAAYGGVFTLDEQIASLADLKVTFSDITEPRITVLGEAGALVTYEQSLSGTFRGKTLPDRVFASELWVKTDGEWLEETYQETVIDSR
jgi:hypothetical protein